MLEEGKPLSSLGACQKVAKNPPQTTINSQPIVCMSIIVSNMSYVNR